MFLASELISRAFYSTGIYSPDIGDGPTTGQLNNGLYLMGEIISSNNLLGEMLKYTTYLNVDAIPGQETYFIPNCVTLQTITFLLGNVRYYMQEKTRNEYFASSRAENINSLPVSFHTEKEFQEVDNVMAEGVLLYVYPLPTNQITFNLEGTFGLPQLELSTDVSLLFTMGDIKYWRLKLASAICEYYNWLIPSQVASALTDIEQKMRVYNSPDLSSGVSIVDPFSKNTSPNYAVYNITKGWYP